MSIAGMGVNTAGRGNPTKIGVDAQAHVGAFFGMELRRDHVLRRDDGRKIDPVLGLADRDSGVRRIGVIVVAAKLRAPAEPDLTDA